MPNVTDITGLGVAAFAIFCMWKLNKSCSAQLGRTLKDLEISINELTIFLRNGK